GEAFQRKLTCAIQRTELDAKEAAKRGDIKDSSLASSTHAGQRSPSHVEDAIHIRCELLINVVHRHFFEEPHMAITGVIDQNVDPAKSRYSSIDGCARLCGVGNVQLN